MFEANGLDDWNLTGLQAVQEGFLSRINISHQGSSNEWIWYVLICLPSLASLNHLASIFNCLFIYLVDPCWLHLFLWFEGLSACGNILISVKWTSAMAIQTFPGMAKALLVAVSHWSLNELKKGKAVLYPKPYRTGLDLASEGQHRLLLFLAGHTCPASERTLNNKQPKSYRVLHTGHTVAWNLKTGLLSSVAATCSRNANKSPLQKPFCLIVPPMARRNSVKTCMSRRSLRKSQWLRKVHHLHDRATTSRWENDYWMIFEGPPFVHTMPHLR